MLYREWLEQWLKAKSTKVKESSYSSYKINIDTHIIPLLGDREIEEIDEDLLQDVLDSMEKSGNRKTGQKLSEKTIKELIRLITTTIKAYCKKNKIPAPFFDDLEFARSGGNACEVFTKDEQRKLLTVLIKSKKPKAIGVGLGLLEGMRIGEIAALKWDDINMDEQIIEVRGTLQRIYRNSEGSDIKSQIVIGTPKTMNSQRKIPFGSTVLFMLQSIIPMCQGSKAAAVIFSDGFPMDPHLPKVPSLGEMIIMQDVVSRWTVALQIHPHGRLVDGADNGPLGMAEIELDIRIIREIGLPAFGN